MDNSDFENHQEKIANFINNTIAEIDSKLEVLDNSNLENIEILEKVRDIFSPFSTVNDSLMFCTEIDLDFEDPQIDLYTDALFNFPRYTAYKDFFSIINTFISISANEGANEEFLQFMQSNQGKFNTLLESFGVILDFEQASTRAREHLFQKFISLRNLKVEDYLKKEVQNHQQFYKRFSKDLYKFSYKEKVSKEKVVENWNEYDSIINILLEKIVRLIQKEE